ncbi:DNA protecting protein DprA [Bordetella genomosp. 10]|uniref:DNA protecting protein DprA n=1 Tax=Bordetella genomosp. 10 TaxID=1416804 RepID=A0A261S3Q1_9BORD|nr:DNA-processing protein DprA [Bordetella genomosp. 10]OZI31966.1 DNA protecting protein DprA [Bordetella genomosp. 10]
MPFTHDPMELSAWLRLSLEPGLRPADAYVLLGAMGLPQQVYARPAAELAQWVPGPLARQLAAPPVPALAARIAAALDWARQPDHHLLCLADAAYPRALLDVGDPPPLLYVRGDPALLARPSLAIVGARNATPDGCDNAHAFARHLAAQGWCVVSGLAAGIDAAAHEGALAAGAAGAATVAVLGTGIDVVYPLHHAALATRIAESGALVSEFPLGTPALPHHFPRRNRLVAGLARGVLVVEAASRSGSLITARLAGEYGREVFAIPGSIHSPLTRGCHALIRQGAKLVESARDIADELGGGKPARAHGPGMDEDPEENVDENAHENTDPHADSQTDQNTDASTHEAMDKGMAGAARAHALPGRPDAALLACLGHDPVHRETLMLRSGLASAELDAALLRLELAGQVARRESGYFQRSRGGARARGKD